MRILLFLLLLLSACSPTRGVFVKNPVGTRWHLTYDNASFGHVEYEIKFLPGGKLFNNHPNEATPDNDRWSRTGNEVELRFNDNYAIYKGTWLNARQMKGTARSEAGGDWEWQAELIE